MAKGTHSPQRTCLGCKKKFDQSLLIRLAKQDQEVVLDQEKRLDSRGAYICYQEECRQKAEKTRALARSLRARHNEEIYLQLAKIIAKREVNKGG